MFTALLSVTRLSCCGGFLFTVGSRQGDSIPGNYVLWSCYSRHDCDWTTAGHYKSILVILITGVMEERGGGEGGRRRREGIREQNGREGVEKKDGKEE